MWEQLAARINKQFNINITAYELAVLHSLELSAMHEMGMGAGQTQWHKMAHGGALDGDLISKGAAQVRGSGTLAPGVLAQPQPTDPLSGTLADPISREILLTATPAGVAGGSMGALANILKAALGVLGAKAAMQVLRTQAGGAARFGAAQFARLPAPLQRLLENAGITSAVIGGIEIDWSNLADLLWPFDDDEEETDEAQVQALIASWGQGDGAMVPFGTGMQPMGWAIVKTWAAGHFKDGRPIRFFRLSNGLNYAERENGTWKPFRYKRGVMIYSDGATTLQHFLRADRALDHQAKQLRRALDRRAPRRQPRALKGPTIIESGPGSVHVR
jgi:hypothetical protein